MAKPLSRFVCQSCGAVHSKWAGQCGDCGAWNSVVEEAAPESAPKGLGGGKAKGRKLELVTLDGAPIEAARGVTGIGEFDRVTGGGMVRGSALLIGGDPGIGKSTLLLQAAALLSKHMPAIYVSGEEAVDQVRMRADRLGLVDAPVELASATSVRDVVATIDGTAAPGLVVIDSIQTMYVDTLDSAPGTVAQVRASAQELIRVAKRRGIALVLVGHVTKEGAIAGPRVLEHMVDTVLYFEGERGHQFRILRAVKNRFGPADEIGVFEMTDAGLAEVANPSALFLSERGQPAPGSVVFAGIEGTRPVLTEIQALVAPSSLGTPRRTVVGLDGARLSTILAVLEARCGIPFAGMDVFLNVAGGMRVLEPAADLAVACALLSAREDHALPAETVVFGEISLSGALRPVAQTENRLKEARKLGFSAAIAPQPAKPAALSGMHMTQMPDLAEVVGQIFGAG